MNKIKKYLTIPLILLVILVFSYYNITVFIPGVWNQGSSSAFDFSAFLVALQLGLMYWSIVLVSSDK